MQPAPSGDEGRAAASTPFPLDDLIAKVDEALRLHGPTRDEEGAAVTVPPASRDDQGEKRPELAAVHTLVHGAVRAVVAANANRGRRASVPGASAQPEASCQRRDEEVYAYLQAMRVVLGSLRLDNSQGGHWRVVFEGSPEAKSAWRSMCRMKVEADLGEVQRIRREQQGIRAEMAELTRRMDKLSALERETGSRFEEADAILEASVNTPVPFGEDPTLWLSDEVLMQVLAAAPIAALWEGRVAGVCRRWHRLSRDPVVLERVKAAKWQAFSDGVIRPLRVRPPPPSAGEAVHGGLLSLAVAPDGTAFAGGINGVVHAWQPVGVGDGPSQWTFRAPDTIASVTAVAVCRGGSTVWTGDDVGTIRVWSLSGELLCVLDNGHSADIWSFAESPDGTVFSASEDTDVRAWRVSIIGGGNGSGNGGTVSECERTLTDHDRPVCAVVATRCGELFSADSGCRVMIWSCSDGTRLRSFAVMGADEPLSPECLALSPEDDRLYVFAMIGFELSTLWCTDIPIDMGAVNKGSDIGWICDNEGQLMMECFDVGPSGEIVTALARAPARRTKGLTVGWVGHGQTDYPVFVTTAAVRGRSCASKIHRVKVGADGTVYTLHWDGVLRAW